VVDLRVRAGLFGRRATWRWCLAAGGAVCILLGIALGIPDGSASTGHGRRHAAAGSTAGEHPSGRTRHAGRRPAGGTTTTANPATGLAAPLPVGSSDGTSLASAQPVATTLPSVHALGVGDTPAAQPVPITTTAAVLIAVIGCGAFGAGWTIGRRRALERA
jgi:hypothetical protein